MDHRHVVLVKEKSYVSRPIPRPSMPSTTDFDEYEMTAGPEAGSSRRAKNGRAATSKGKDGAGAAVRERKRKRRVIGSDVDYSSQDGGDTDHAESRRSMSRDRSMTVEPREDDGPEPLFCE